MKTNTKIIMLLICLFSSAVFGFMPGENEGRPKMDMMNKGMMMNKNMMMGGMMDDIIACEKINMMLRHAEHIGLSKEQIEKIESIKNEAKKNQIKKQAEIDVLKIDLSSLINKEEDVNPDSLKNIILKIANLEGENKFICIEAMINTKKILNDEQKKKIQEIMKKQKSDMMQMQMNMNRINKKEDTTKTNNK